MLVKWNGIVMNGISWRLVLFSLALVSVSSYAGIVVNSTRVIYSADQKEVTVGMRNTGKSPSLVQSWIDTGDPSAAPESIHVPFVIMPPITRIDGGKGQTLRLVYTGGDLPKDRESVFWLNILAVPPKKLDTSNHYLNVAYQTRVKLFYRPTGLKMSPERVAEKLQWKIEAHTLIAYNPTPYYISLANVDWESAGKTISVPGVMVAPFGQNRIEIKQDTPLAAPLNYTIIDDLGRAETLSSALN